MSVSITDTNVTLDKGTDGTDTVSGYSSGNIVGLTIEMGSGNNTLTVDNSNLNFLV